MGSNIVRAAVTIVGTRPLLFNRFGRDAIPLEKTEKTGVSGNDPEEWKRTVLATKDGQLYVEPSYVFAAILAGAFYTKKGRGSIQSMVAATLQVLDNIILLDRWLPDGLNSLPEDPSLPVYLDVRGVRNPSNKSRNVRYRVAVAPGWRATFRIAWDVTIVSRAQMQAAVIDGGRFSGLGDGRKIGFGRFEVERFEIEGEEHAETTAA